LFWPPARRCDCGEIRLKKWILVAAGLLTVAAAGLVIARRTHRAPATTPVAAPAPTAPSQQEMVLSGRVTARTIVAVSSPIEGTLETFFVDVGAEVIQGQLLGRVRNPKADAAIQQSQEAAGQARARLTELNSQQLAAKLEISRTEAEQSRARSDLDR